MWRKVADDDATLRFIDVVKVFTTRIGISVPLRPLSSIELYGRARKVFKLEVPSRAILFPDEINSLKRVRHRDISSALSRGRRKN